MKTRPVLFKTTTVIALALFLLPAVIVFDAGAGPRHPAPVFKHVPPGARRVKHKNVHYVVHKGRFYKPGKAGYVFVRPPVGAVVLSLPSAAAAVVFAGVTYYMFEDTYYKRVPTGYVVVERPTARTVVVKETVVPAVSGNQVAVSVTSLNVRTGPGKKHAVIGQVSFGNVLTVQGNAPDWIYVQLPDGRYGWVMKRFVSQSVSVSKG